MVLIEDKELWQVPRYTQVHSTVIVEDFLFKNKISNNSQIERDFD